MTGVMPFAASILFKVTVVSAAALVGTRLARNSRAAVRHLLLAAAFATLLVVPLISVVSPSITVAVPIAVPAQTASLDQNIVDATAAPAQDGADRFSTRAGQAPWPSWPVLTAGAWVLGTTLFLLPVVTGLWQVRSLRRSGRPWPRGQSIVDGLARDAAVARRVGVLLHDSVPGPMTCGIFRPAIVLPIDTEHWSEQNLRRAVVHELEHVRRGDWASQCLARVACTLYWFHPLVWVAWRELALEAERACDDAVLRLPSTAPGAVDEATAYADQLVILAERLSAAANSPVLAMANRHDLAARVRAVLDSRQRRGRAGTRWIATASAAAALVLVSVAPLRIIAVAASSRTPQPEQKFDVISIRPCENEPPTPPGQRSGQGGFPTVSPGAFTIECGTVERLISNAYVLNGEPLANQAARIGDVEWLKGVPGWLRSEKFTIEAKAAGNPDRKVMLGPMLRALLEDRFKLKIHRATDEVPMYEMTLAKGGLKIAPDTCDDGERPEGRLTPESMAALRAGTVKPRCGNMTMLNNEGRHLWIIGGPTMASFAGTLSTFMDHHVIDKTGVEGRFNIRLEFAPDEHVPGPDKRYGPPTSVPEVEGPNIFKALEQQVGVTLTPTKGTHGFLVIDHVERPSPNTGPRLIPSRTR